MISTRDLQLLPDVEHFRLAFQSMALLDAIIEPEWQLRFYSFEANVPPDGAVSLGSMRNGSGDELHAIFSGAGCLIRGFVQKCPLTPYASKPPKVHPGVLDDIPPEFTGSLVALHSDRWRDITCCIWRQHADDAWHHGNIAFPDGPDPDGSSYLLSRFDGKPETYHRWAEEYYQPRRFDPDAIRFVFAQRPLTENVVRALNPERFLPQLVEEIRYINYAPEHVFYG